MRDDAIEIFADDCVLRGIDDQRQPVLRIAQFAALSAVKFLVGAAQFFLNPLAIADVANDAQNHRSIIRCHRAEADLHRKFRSVATPSIEIESRSHASNLGLLVEMLAMEMMLWPLPVRDQNLDLLSDQFVARVTEQGFRLRIDLNDDALLVHRRHGVRNRFQNAER